MTLKEALNEFEKEYSVIKEKLLFSHLIRKYAQQFFRDHKDEFKKECYDRAKELYKKYPAEVERFWHSPIFNEDGTMNTSEDTNVEVVMPHRGDK
jgi:hypothetical protein